MRYDLETGKIEKFSIFILFFFGIFMLLNFYYTVNVGKWWQKTGTKKKIPIHQNVKVRDVKLNFVSLIRLIYFVGSSLKKSKTSDEITERSIFCFLFPEHLGFFREFSLINIRQKKITFSFSKKQFAGCCFIQDSWEYFFLPFLRKNFKILLMSDPIFVDYNLDFS